jgi:hypothetical protein
MSLLLRNLNLTDCQLIQVLDYIYSIRTTRRIAGYLAPDMPDFDILELALQNYLEQLKTEAITLKGQIRLEL